MSLSQKCQPGAGTDIPQETPVEKESARPCQPHHLKAWLSLGGFDKVAETRWHFLIVPLPIRVKKKKIPPSLHLCLLCGQSPNSSQPTPTGSDSSYLSALSLIPCWLLCCPSNKPALLPPQGLCTCCSLSWNVSPRYAHCSPSRSFLKRYLLDLLKFLTPLHPHSCPSPLLYFSLEHLPPSNILILFNILSLH